MTSVLQRILLVLSFVFTLSSISFAQLSGVIINSESLEPIPAVNVSFPEHNVGTSSAEDGSFYINWKIYPVKVTFSALGYEQIDQFYSAADTNLIVYLKPSVMSLEEIVVMPDRTINPITNSSPIARSTVSIEQLSDKAVTTAVELLRAETGVFVQQTSVGQGSLYIRGRAGRDVLYLFNGFRMNPSFVRSGQNQYFGAIDPFLISKLDVYRGPVSVYYGSDALSGGVNISPIVKKFSYEKELTGEVASFLNFQGNGEKSIHGKLAYQGPTFTLFAGGSFRDYDYYNMSEQSNEALWFPYDETLSNADYQFKSYQISSNIKISDRSNLSLISYNGRIPDAPRIDRTTLGYSIESADDGIRPRNGYYSNTSPLVFWGNTVEYRLISKKAAFQNVGIKAGFFKLKDFRKQQDFDINNPPAFSINQEDRDYSFTISDTTNFDRSTSNQFLASIDVLSRISPDLYLKWGGDLSFDHVNSERVSNFGQVRLPRYPDGSEYMLGGIFAQVDYAPSNRFSIEYGVRYSRAHASIPFEGVNTNRKFDPYSDSFGQFTHALGLSYNLSDDLALVSNLSTGFRAPNVSDLAEIGTRSNDQFQTPNTDLKPETSRNLDIGTMYDTENYSFEFYAFWLHYSNKINREETGNFVNEFGEVLPADSVTYIWDTFREVRNENATSMELLGVEFAGEYSNNDFIKTGLTFTYTWGNLINLDRSTQPVDRIPPANGILYVDYTPAPKITIRPQARYAFAHRRISPAEKSDNRVSQNGTDGFMNLQLLINMRPQDDVTIKFVADNIMDEAYREHASSLDGMGRNFTISISYKF
ncbi:MAG: TonB-dependent receptor [Balneolaceae bacterium]|nr:TonB-dependent receptor [Balneolaceae bacterium]